MLDLNRIYAMECIDGMRQMDDESVSVIVTSPPYNIGAPYTMYVDRQPRDQYLTLIEKVAAESHRILHDDGSFYLNIGGSLNDPWLPYDVANQFRCHYTLQNVIHWIKSISINREDVGAASRGDQNLSVGHYKPINSKRFHHNCHEYIFQFTKTGDVELDKLATGVPYQDKTNIRRWDGNQNRDLRDRGNAWFIPYATVSGARQHPTTFPVNLPTMCLKDHGVAKIDLVLDPFIGIGTTALACIDLSLNYIGFDIDPAYVELATEATRRMRASVETYPELPAL